MLRLRGPFAHPIENFYSVEQSIEVFEPDERVQAGSAVMESERVQVQLAGVAGILDSLADKCYKPVAIFLPLLRHGYVPVLNRFSRDPQLLFGSTEAPQA